ncbi:flagellar associated protein putative: flagellar associated protein [Ochromonadaceae sp. CCMP2298]|nr:flagellar associated protein putative: flagellar associated protein [Ochromonadaceae sp. CCMP2298]
MSVDLKIKSVIGFNGKIRQALLYSPCGKYLVYPLGSFVVVKNVVSDKEAFLDGHSNEISCIAMSNDGRTLASGQLNLMGVKADIIVWDFEEAKRLLDCGTVMLGEKTTIHRLKQHLGRVQGISFSPNNAYLATIGGQDDNTVVIWDAASGVAICGSPAARDSVLCVKWLNNRNDRVVTAGNYHIKVWQVDFSLPKLHAMDCRLGSVRRVFLSITIEDNDCIAYFGTTTGDIVKASIDRNELISFKDPDTTVPQLLGITKHRFANGANIVLCVQNPATGNTNVLVGAGDGTLAFVNPNLNMVAGYKTQLMGGVTSIAIHPKGTKFAVGTDQCNRYELSSDLIGAELKTSCHFGAINDIAFPDGCPDLVVTSSFGDIRVWNSKDNKELLRIQVPNLECLCSLVTPSGGAILSGWDDGKIRAFYPETGRMKFVIPDAHSEKVTALGIADNDSRSPWRIVSGGDEGRVRIWKVTSSHQALLASLKEHRGAVNCIKVNADFSQCISASADGSCIVWDLERCVRVVALFEPNVFNSVLYHPDESQMLTCGSNHKITYWDAADGQIIRVIDGGEDGMTTLDIVHSGEFFVSGSKDKNLKMWHYDDGLPIAIGRGHSGTIKAVKISPDEKTIVSVGSTGEIIFWEMPDLDAFRDSMGAGAY